MPRPTRITSGRGWWGLLFTLIVGLGVASTLGYFDRNGSSPESPVDKGAKPEPERAKTIPAQSPNALDWAATGGIPHTGNPAAHGGNADCAGQIFACIPTSTAPAPVSAVSAAIAPARETSSASLASQGGEDLLGSAAQQYSGHLPFQHDLATLQKDRHISFKLNARFESIAMPGPSVTQSKARRDLPLLPDP